MTASPLLKNTVSIEEWSAATTFVKQRNIQYSEKNYSLRLIAVT